MVRIQKVTKGASDVQPHRTDSSCTFQTVIGEEGEALLHIATYGSAGRAMPGKASQQIQFTESAARDLLDAIHLAFPRLSAADSSKQVVQDTAAGE